MLLSLSSMKTKPAKRKANCPASHVSAESSRVRLACHPCYTYAPTPSALNRDPNRRLNIQSLNLLRSRVVCDRMRRWPGE